MASIILPPGTAPASPTEGEIYYDNTAKQVKFRDNAGFKGLGGADLQGEPHIITKKLFPAYLGKLLDDTTSHSGDYGTEQSDGRMYYYTDIAGSKPIHDPRVGVHFGSQRHKFKSIQLLEQETATHGKDVYSVDGREWIRVVAGTNTPKMINSDNTQGIEMGNDAGNCTDSFFEITGYFNNFNWLSHTSAVACDDIKYYLNGATGVSVAIGGRATVSTPLHNRYVDSSAVLAGASLGTTPSINTIKLKVETGSSEYWYTSGCELIAQDTTSSSTKVQIQVPAQDVVSYGRKFSVSATAQHYDPFNGFSSGNATTLATKVDTATSLGLSKWLHSSTYYRPYNGMRVVKWIDENGAIKTSVTCMPPNAKSILDSSSLTNANAKANASVANNTFYPTFEAHTTSVNEDNLHEIARIYHFREFGSGSANAGVGGAFADATMLNASDDISFCFDDGLTGLVGSGVASVADGLTGPNSGTPTWYCTFIGTGVSIYAKSYGNMTHQICQNLPYGTHILKGIRDVPNTDAKPSYTIDGILLDNVTGDTYGTIEEVHIYQPKKPPIPNSACVLADYMVFADFKPQTTAGTQLISKGVRRQNISRDVFFDETDGDSFSFTAAQEAEGFVIYLSGNADSDTSMKLRIPSFGTNYVHRGYQSDTRTKLFIGDTDNDSASTKDNTAGHGSYAHLTSDLTLGVHQFGSNAVSGQNGNTTAFDIVTPIHTSHHYQPFSTPFQDELIGGDRSMEQTNLICSPEGHTWDQITRNVDYLQKQASVMLSQGQNENNSSNPIVFETQRGKHHAQDYFINNRDFAYGLNRFICLREGSYKINAHTISQASGQNGQHAQIRVNGTEVALGHCCQSNHVTAHVSVIIKLQRGDNVQVYGRWYGSTGYSSFIIERL